MLEIGEVIDNKYKILYEIGKGGMSHVYLAINEAAGKEWAVKEVMKKGDGVKQDPVTETNIMRKLSNPHLPQIIDVIPREDSFLIVMDYIEGITLKKKLETESRQKQEDVVDWAIQLCDVLHYLHTRRPPIIYRDLKPVNIMLQPDGKIVLIDFGIAREYREGAMEDTRTLGTRGYAAPEQYGGQGQTDQRTDIYNLGATMYHLVTGKDPARPPYEMKPIRYWDPVYSTGLEWIIMKCTQNDPEKRYQSAAELKYALEHYRDLEAAHLEKKRKKWKKLVALMAAGAASILCATGLRAYAGALRTGTYESLMHEAEISTDAQEAVKTYFEAAKVRPAAMDAYTSILDIYLSDGVFTKEEAEEMTRILGYRGSGDSQSLEEKLEKNRKDHAEVCYEMGLAYFYSYEDLGNKQLSRPWLRAARDSGELDERKHSRAERLCRIADYYNQLGVRDKAGDSTANYADYWEDLVKLSGDDIAKKDNIRTALVMYGELAYQAGARAMEFRDAGVGKGEILYELGRIEKVVTEDIIGSEGYTEAEYGEKTDEVLENIRAARRVLETVYASAGRKGGAG